MLYQVPLKSFTVSMMNEGEQLDSNVSLDVFMSLRGTARPLLRFEYIYK